MPRRLRPGFARVGRQEEKTQGSRRAPRCLPVWHPLGRRGLTRPALACLAAVLGLTALATTHAPGRQIAIEHFDARIEVDSAGWIRVTETINFRFTGAWNGVVRDIPVDYQTPRGLRFHLRLSPEAITDRGGSPLRYESSRQRNCRSFKIWVPDAQDTNRTVVLRYRAENALRFFERHDELGWNVTGDEWEMPIQAATAMVVLPASATGIRALALAGGGSPKRAVPVTVDGTTVYFSPNEPPGVGGLSVIVRWDKGAVQEPGAVEKALGLLRANWTLLLVLVLCLLASLLIVYLCRARGRPRKASHGWLRKGRRWVKVYGPSGRKVYRPTGSWASGGRTDWEAGSDRDRSSHDSGGSSDGELGGGGGRGF